MLDFKIIQEKKEILSQLKIYLKKEFVGLDKVIDKIVNSLEIWYIFPQLLTRPLVINLWGMTGVGKTDLVRKLVGFLKFKEKYLEIQLNPDSSKYTTIQNSLKNLNISSDEAAILLLDEIQRFSTINNDGSLVRDAGYQDLWELLSDGSFSDSTQEEFKLQMALFRLLYDMDYEENSKKEQADGPRETTGDSDVKVSGDCPSNPKKRKYQTYYWEAKEFKNLIESNLSIAEIMTLTTKDRISMLKDRLDSLDQNIVSRKYNQLLIFISGNLDQAYQSSSSVSDVETDADIIHELNLQVNVLTIKDCLLKKFKPEQIARFGNNHIIYPTLTKSNFYELIDRGLAKIKDKFYNLSKIDITYTSNLREVIYTNGVYPSQGTRPLFSTLDIIIENTLPEFLMYALQDNAQEILLDVNELKSHMLCYYKVDNNIKTLEKEVNLQINDLKKEVTLNDLALGATHEAGHALCLMLLFKTVPAQITCGGISNHSDGFIIPPKLSLSKETLLKKIQVLYAGQIAETLIFGKDQVSPGSQEDNALATQIASGMFRKCNMFNQIGYSTPNGIEWPRLTVNNFSETNSEILKILKKQYNNAYTLLQNNQDSLKRLIKKVMTVRVMSSKEIITFMKKDIPDLQEKRDSLFSYYDTLTNFLEK